MKINVRKLCAKEIYTLVICIYPIMCVYGINIGVSIPFILLVLLVIDLYFLIHNKFKIKINTLFLPIIIYLFFQTLLYFFSPLLLSNTIHYLIYIVNITCFCSEYFNRNLALKYVKYISLFASVYLIIQNILLSLFGFYIPGTIDFLPVLRDDITLFNQEASMTFANGVVDFRARSIFAEPAGFGSYVCIGLYTLLIDEKNKEDIFFILLITISMILIRANTSLVLMILVYAFYLIKNVVPNIRKKRNIIFLLVLICGIIIFAQSNVFIYYFSRLSGSSSIVNRFGNISFAFSSNSFELLFGHGMIDIAYSNYLPDFFKGFYYFGFCGQLLFFIIMIFIFMKKDDLNKLVVLVILLSSIGGAGYIGVISMYYFPFIIYKKTKRGELRD